MTIVAGAVQKYVSKKKFKKYSGKAEGSGWGVNLGGELFLSSSNYSLDIIYGLDLLAYREAGSPADAEVVLNEGPDVLQLSDPLSNQVSVELSVPGAFGDT